MIEIKFIPTGHIFSLPDEEAIRIVKEDRGNYKDVKEKYLKKRNRKKANRFKNWSLLKKVTKARCRPIMIKLNHRLKTKINPRKLLKNDINFS